MKKTVLVKPHENPLTLTDVFNICYQWAKTHDFSYVVDIYSEYHEDSEEFGPMACKYRSDNNNNACLAGCLIPDEIYDDNIESLSIHHLLSGKYKNILTDSSQKNINIIHSLQGVHDRYARYSRRTDQLENKEGYLAAIIKLAETHGIEIENE